MKIILFTIFCLSCLAYGQADVGTVNNAVTGTATTYKGVGTKVTNINILLYGTHRLVGVAELADEFSSQYLWTNVSKEDIVQKGRNSHTVFLYEGPYNYPAVSVEGKLVKTEKGYSAKEIKFAYKDPQTDGTEVIEKVSGFLVKYGEARSYLVSWTFKEAQHDGEDDVFAGRLHGSIKIKDVTFNGQPALEVTYNLNATNLNKTQVANFMKWWLYCTSQPPD